MEAFGPYFTERYETFWGKAINFDDEPSDPVREWVLQSGRGLGLRLSRRRAAPGCDPRDLRPERDADRRGARRARPRGAPRGARDRRVRPERPTRDPTRARPAASDATPSGPMTSTMPCATLLTGERDGYYEEFGAVADLAKAYRRPFVHDGQYSSFRKRRFGAPAEDRPAEQFVVFSQNHDQVGNRAYGERLPSRGAAAWRRSACCSRRSRRCCSWARSTASRRHSSSSPTTSTSGSRAPHVRAVAASSRPSPPSSEEIPDPQDPATFERSKLTGQRESDLADLYARLIAARRELTGELDAVEFDEPGRWLRLRRGPHEMICNFARARRHEASVQSQSSWESARWPHTAHDSWRAGSS